jgi:hypothetical protein
LFKPGDCLQIVSGSYEDGKPKRHPFVVVTDFDEKTGDAILVSFSSTKDKPATTRPPLSRRGLMILLQKNLMPRIT